MRAEQVTDPITYHGEGPVWAEHWGTAASGLAAGGGLRWVDMLAGDLMHLDPSGAVGPGTTAGRPLAAEAPEGPVVRIPTPSSVAACVRPARAPTGRCT